MKLEDAIKYLEVEPKAFHNMTRWLKRKGTASTEYQKDDLDFIKKYAEVRAEWLLMKKEMEKRAK